MTCEHVTLPGGGRAIICGPRQPHQKCPCGRRATQLCDWKMPNAEDQRKVRGSATCDKPLCDQCTTSPAPDKDLCPAHAAEWRKRQGREPTKCEEVSHD
jgi:hypothetical protein